MTMQPHGNGEPEELLTSRESDLVKLKSSRGGGDVRKRRTGAACTFVNDLANYNRPGVRFVGIRKAVGMFLSPPCPRLERRRGD